jgi:hypothetical protein
MRSVFVLFAAGALFVLSGCSCMPTHFGQIENYPASNDYQLVDDPAPDEEMCTLIIDGGLTLTGIIDISSKRLAGGSYASWESYLQITAGERTLTFDYSSTSSNDSGGYTIITTSSAEDIDVTYEFEPGHTYKVFPRINYTENSVVIEIEETSFPVRFGFRMGPYLGWHRSTSGFPFTGPFILVQTGVAAPIGNSIMEFMAEANLGFIGYHPFEEDASMFNTINAQAGGTANFYFGKSLKKMGLALAAG